MLAQNSAAMLLPPRRRYIRIRHRYRSTFTNSNMPRRHAPFAFCAKRRHAAPMSAPVVYISEYTPSDIRRCLYARYYRFCPASVTVAIPSAAERDQAERRAAACRREIPSARYATSQRENHERRPAPDAPATPKRNAR